MSLQDPIADMLARIKNAQAVTKKVVSCQNSKVKVAIAGVLKSEGYITAFETLPGEGKPQLQITLKYYDEKPVIETLRRASRPGLRVYKSKNEIPRVKNGLGIAIVSTSKGVLSDNEARKQCLGGEILC